MTSLCQSIILINRFSKVFGNVGKATIDALKEYGKQVRSREFPESPVHTYKMIKGQEELFSEWVKSHKKQI